MYSNENQMDDGQFYYQPSPVPKNQEEHAWNLHPPSSSLRVHLYVIVVIQRRQYLSSSAHRGEDRIQGMLTTKRRVFHSMGCFAILSI